MAARRRTRDTDLRGAAETESRFLVESRLRARQRDVVPFLADSEPAVRELAFRLWADTAGLSVADVATITGGVLTETREG